MVQTPRFVSIVRACTKTMSRLTWTHIQSVLEWWTHNVLWIVLLAVVVEAGAVFLRWHIVAIGLPCILVGMFLLALIDYLKELRE